MTVFLLRHAHKEQGEHYNPALRHQDPPITVNGQKSARTLTKYFQWKDIDVIYISQYRRTMETAKQIAKRLHIVPKVDGRLNEIDSGLLEGLNETEIMRRFPETWNAYIQRNQDFRFPEGETGTEATARIISLLTQVSLTDRNALFVTHEGLMRLLICHVLGIEVYRRWEFTIDPLGIIEIEFQEKDKAWRLRKINQIFQMEMNNK